MKAGDLDFQKNISVFIKAIYIVSIHLIVVALGAKINDVIKARIIIS